MPIAIADKTVALLVALSREIIEKLPPVERRRLAEQCRRVAAIADPPRPVQRAAASPGKAGVLADLERRQQHE
jgi:hypothetical protein